jgi:hypothetical protein
VWEYLWKLKPKMIGSGLSYEMRVIRSVNTLHVDNLGPSSIWGTHVEISVHFNMKTINIYIRGKNYSVFGWHESVVFIPEWGMLHICRPARVSLFLSLFCCCWKHVYVQVVVIVARIFPWFYVQERLKCPLWVGDAHLY